VKKTWSPLLSDQGAAKSASTAFASAARLLATFASKVASRA
jgi:hypothetical protein